MAVASAPGSRRSLWRGAVDVAMPRVPLAMLVKLTPAVPAEALAVALARVVGLKRLWWRWRRRCCRACQCRTCRRRRRLIAVAVADDRSAARIAGREIGYRIRAISARGAVAIAACAAAGLLRKVSMLDVEPLTTFVILEAAPLPPAPWSPEHVAAAVAAVLAGGHVDRPPPVDAPITELTVADPPLPPLPVAARAAAVSAGGGGGDAED